MDIENKYGTLAIQKELLVLLKEFHSFCKRNNIQYSLAYGSLLGAVRHKGLIPWHDDLDIMVDRDNYSVLRSALISESDCGLILSSEGVPWVDRIRMLSGHYSGTYNPTIDVFIIDEVPSHHLKAKIKLYLIYALQGMMKPEIDLSRGSLPLKLCSILTYLLGRLFPVNLKKRWYTLVSQWKSKGHYSATACYNAAFKDVHCLFPSDLLSEIVTSDFEDTQVCIVSRYDSFLKSRYGDYLTPVSDKTPKHLK